MEEEWVLRLLTEQNGVMGTALNDEEHQQMDKNQIPDTKVGFILICLHMLR
jgi:hypothetical protein